MSDDIFANEAPKYWERKLPVVPVEPGTKRPPPEMKGWQGNLAALPNEEKRTAWLGQYPNHGVGLLLGIPIDSGEVIDALDVDDDKLRKLVRFVVGLNRAAHRAVLAAKRGKKGATIFVRAPKSLKSTVVTGAGGLGNIDFLASGRMTVMPPSIHPETEKPYEVIGQSLLEVDFATLPPISDHQLELLRATIGSEFAAAIISGTATHDAGVRLTAVLVGAGATDDEITTVFAGLLPDDYRGNSLQELPEWIKSARKKGFDKADKSNDKQSTKLIKLALREGMELFRDAEHSDIALATLPTTGPAIAYRVTSTVVKMWLRHMAHKTWKKPVGTSPLNEAIATLQARALFEGEPHPAFSRVAGDDKSITIDLGWDDGQMVRIGPEGWKMETSPPHKFLRGAGF